MFISVHVKPGSKKAPLVITQPDGSLIVYLKERAVDGAANEALITLLSKHLEVSKSSISIKSGYASRRKIISIS